jgi:hypothetical protein
MSALTEQQTLLLDLIYEDGLPVDVLAKAIEVKEKAGYAAKTSIYQILRPLKDAITERNQEYMILDASKSITALHDVVRTPTKPGNDQLIKAANSLLDRSGFGKKETDVVEIKADKGIVILPAKRD